MEASGVAGANEVALDLHSVIKLLLYHTKACLLLLFII